MIITIISNKSQVQWIIFIANKLPGFFIMWSLKAQTSKQVSNFILNKSGIRPLPIHWIMIFITCLLQSFHPVTKLLHVGSNIQVVSTRHIYWDTLQENPHVTSHAKAMKLVNQWYSAIKGYLCYKTTLCHKVIVDV